MNSLMQVLQERRSIRKFSAEPVSANQRQQLLEAALRAPSSRGRNPWEFVVVQEPALLEQLGTAKLSGSAFLAGAPLAIAIAADPQQCDVWIEDSAIAATLIQLTATSLGLGSCWAQIRLREHQAGGQSANDFLVDLLGLPQGYQVPMVIGIGHPAEEKPGHQRSELQWSKLHAERFGTPLTED